MIGIYLITNTINGKQYIGKSINLDYRWAAHKSDARCNRYDIAIHRAIRKYGEENFTFEVIATTEDESLLDDLERELIVEYNTYGNSGYNMTWGGDGNYRLSEESRKKISDRNSGEGNAWYGKFGKEHVRYGMSHTEETKKSLRETHTFQIVVHYTDGSIKDFGKVKVESVLEELGIGKDTFSNLANGHREDYKGIKRIELLGGIPATRKRGKYKNAKTYRVHLKDGTYEDFQGQRDMTKKYKSCKPDYIPRKLEHIVNSIEIIQ